VTHWRRNGLDPAVFGGTGVKGVAVADWSSAASFSPAPHEPIAEERASKGRGGATIEVLARLELGGQTPTEGDIQDSMKGAVIAALFKPPPLLTIAFRIDSVRVGEPRTTG
jgi:hypothetical protein